MENVKQHLFDGLVEEFNNKPGFLLAKTIFLFCHYNPVFDLPEDVKKVFINGLLQDEIRAFSLRYQKKIYETANGSIDALEKEMYDARAAVHLSKGTGKTYSPGMVDTVTTRFKKILSYNDILESFIMSGR